MGNTILVHITVQATFPKSPKRPPTTTAIVHPAGSSPFLQPRVEFPVWAREGVTADQLAAWFFQRSDWGEHPVSGDIWTWQVEQVRVWATERMRERLRG